MSKNSVDETNQSNHITAQSSVRKLFVKLCPILKNEINAHGSSITGDTLNICRTMTTEGSQRIILLGKSFRVVKKINFFSKEEVNGEIESKLKLWETSGHTSAGANQNEKSESKLSISDNIPAGAPEKLHSETSVKSDPELSENAIASDSRQLFQDEFDTGLVKESRYGECTKIRLKRKDEPDHIEESMENIHSGTIEKSMENIHSGTIEESMENIHSGIIKLNSDKVKQNMRTTSVIRLNTNAMNLRKPAREPVIQTRKVSNRKKVSEQISNNQVPQRILFSCHYCKKGNLKSLQSLTRHMQVYHFKEYGGKSYIQIQEKQKKLKMKGNSTNKGRVKRVSVLNFIMKPTAEFMKGIREEEFSIEELIGEGNTNSVGKNTPLKKNTPKRKYTRRSFVQSVDGSEIEEVKATILKTYSKSYAGDQSVESPRKKLRNGEESGEIKQKNVRTYPSAKRRPKDNWQVESIISNLCKSITERNESASNHIDCTEMGSNDCKIQCKLDFRKSGQNIDSVKEQSICGNSGSSLFTEEPNQCLNSGLKVQCIHCWGPEFYDENGLR